MAAVHLPVDQLRLVRGARVRRCRTLSAGLSRVRSGAAPEQALHVRQDVAAVGEVRGPAEGAGSGTENPWLGAGPVPEEQAFPRIHSARVGPSRVRALSEAVREVPRVCSGQLHHVDAGEMQSMLVLLKGFRRRRLEVRVWEGAED